jgi:hypothetical protein
VDLRAQAAAGAVKGLIFRPPFLAPAACWWARIDLAVPAFGYKNHVAIDRRHGLIRGWTASHAAAHDGARLAEVVDADSTAALTVLCNLARCAAGKCM